MKISIPVFLSVLCSGFPPLNAAVIGYFEQANEFRGINSLTGQTTLIAKAGGGTLTNTIFTTDQQSGIVYRGSSTSTVIRTDLATGISSSVSFSGQAYALGVFNHRLIGFFDSTNEYREINPVTGQTTLVAKGGGGTLTNTIFALDQQSGIAYRGSSPSTLITTDLTTGISRTVSFAGEAYALGVFGHRLIGFFDSANEYREINPVTGQTTLVAKGGGGTFTNTIFALDQQSGIAYRGSSLSTLITTDLNTGASSTVSFSGPVYALGVYSVPEPSSWSLLAGLGMMCLLRRTGAGRK